jgi:hypothetical protein
LPVVSRKEARRVEGVVTADSVLNFDDHKTRNRRSA